MTRRPKVGGKPIKGRLPNAQKPRRSKMAKAAPRSMSSSSRDQTEVTRLTCELNAAIERQNATAEILASVSRSSTDTRPVFDAILDNLLRLFGQAHPFVDNGTFCFSSQHRCRDAPARQLSDGATPYSAPVQHALPTNPEAQ